MFLYVTNSFCYVDQEFIKMSKKMILDIARFETTTTFYGDVAFLESDYSSGDETHPFPSGDNVEIVTFEKSNNNTGIPIKIKSVREDYPLTGRSTPMLRGKNTPVLRYMALTASHQDLPFSSEVRVVCLSGKMARIVSTEARGTATQV